MRYKAGDVVICRSEYGTDYLTKGKEYVVIKGEDITRYFDEVSRSMDLTIVIECDDGEQRPVSKLKFVPATQVVAKKGKLEVLKPVRKRD